jgi:hypothetical protein
MTTEPLWLVCRSGASSDRARLERAWTTAFEFSSAGFAGSSFSSAGGTTAVKSTAAALADESSADETFGQHGLGISRASWADWITGTMCGPGELVSAPVHDR